MNRDSSFLSILGSALSPNAANLTSSTCCNPLATPHPLAIDSSLQQYSAAVAVCGLSTKCADDADDESGLRRVTARSVLGFTGNWKDKAIAFLNTTGFPTQSTINALSHQSNIETPTASVREVATPTATAYGNIFTHLGTMLGVANTQPLTSMGQSLGSLIYYRDAVDDLKKDRARGRYNPLTHRPLEELLEASQEAFTQLRSSLSSLPILRHQQLITDISDRTQAYHMDLTHPPSHNGKRNKKDKKKDQSCCDHCDCCDCDCCDCIPCGTGSLACSNISCGSAADSGSGCCDSCNCGSCACCSCN